MQFRNGKCHELKQRCEVDLRHVIECRRRQFRALAEHLPDGWISAWTKFKADDRFVTTLPNLLPMATHLGADAMLQKPFTPDEVIRAIQAVVPGLSASAPRSQGPLEQAANPVAADH